MKRNLKIVSTLTLSALIIMSLYLFSFADPPGPPAPPTISGSPTTTVTVGTAYSFAPSSANATGFANTGTILPSWLTLNTTTGALTGTPTTAGTVGNIIITASNAAGSMSLPAFTITVAPSLSVDTTSPKLTALSFTPTTLNVGTSGQSIIVKTSATDDSSGIYNVSVNITAPSGYGYSAVNILQSGNNLNGNYQYTYSLPKNSETGTWHVSFISMTDNAGNTSSYWENDLKSLGYSTTFQVSSGSSGTSGGNTSGTQVPVMDGIWMLPGVLAGLGLFARRRKE